MTTHACGLPVYLHVLLLYSHIEHIFSTLHCVQALTPLSPEDVSCREPDPPPSGCAPLSGETGPTRASQRPPHQLVQCQCDTSRSSFGACGELRSETGIVGKGPPPARLLLEVRAGPQTGPLALYSCPGAKPQCGPFAHSGASAQRLPGWLMRHLRRQAQGQSPGPSSGDTAPHRFPSAPSRR